ncbi:hypothetical protein ACVGVM_17890 [Pseudonocardia bannensis]|uniref:Uncharacterized protein n=1 Tax=Pseudonocardia bannensis TaxID=630973 RepID=A0A848DRR6_9PSEU|nr:hypothetical protein [Pseudonocardia bannensis]NMH95071.1 hypothetical protein [Pseudonocardia bannensis]
MIIDCDSCEVRGDACGDCVIGVLLGAPERRVPSGEVPSGASIVQLDAREQRALDVLADQGLVPRLRLVATPPRRVTHGLTTERDAYNAG